MADMYFPHNGNNFNKFLEIQNITLNELLYLPYLLLAVGVISILFAIINNAVMNIPVHITLFWSFRSFSWTRLSKVERGYEVLRL